MSLLVLSATVVGCSGHSPLEAEGAGLQPERHSGANWAITPEGLAIAPEAPAGFERYPASIRVQYILHYLETQQDSVVVANPNLMIVGLDEGCPGETIPFRSTFWVSDFGRVTERESSSDVGLKLDPSTEVLVGPDLVRQSEEVFPSVVSPEFSALLGPSNTTTPTKEGR